MHHVKIATYNVHRCRGMDGRYRPDRIAKVLRDLEADVIALQEVWSVTGEGRHQDQAAYLAEELGYHMVAGMNRAHRGGTFGNVVLSRFPISNGRNYDISVEGRQRRGCLRADVELSDKRVLHVFNIHLGTALRERQRQGRRLIDERILDNGELHGPRVVLGDFNDWTARLAAQLLHANLNGVDIRTHLRRSRTYPGLVPLLHLDHIYFDDRLELEQLALVRNRRTVVASDHLPLVGCFRLLTAAPAGTAASA